MAHLHDAVFSNDLSMKSVKSSKKPSRHALPSVEVASALHLYKLGLNSEAEQAFRSYLSKHPQCADALHGCGLALHAQGRSDEATGFIERAIAREPMKSHYQLNLALCLAAVNQPVDAIKTLRKAVKIQPDFVDAWFNLAVLSSQIQDAEAAEADYRQVLSLAPAHLASLNNLGDLLAHTDRTQEAVALLRRALTIRPDFLDAQYNLARIILDEHPGEAASLLERVVRSRPKLVDAYRLQAKALAKNADHEAARAVLEQAILSEPDEAGLHNDLGLVCLELGDLTQAVHEFERAIELDPGQVYALYNLAFSVKARAHPDLLGKIQHTLSHVEHLGQEERALLHFAAGHLLEATQDYERAFHEFDCANNLKHAPYERDQTEQFFQSIKDVFTPDYFASAAKGSSDTLPVFILGMPRSGTTLVEQILSSHPQAQGVGELLWFNQQANNLARILNTDTPFPYSACDISADRAQELANTYLAELRRRGGNEARRVSDKMPGNFVNLGLIAQLLPGAKVIHCQRDPLDTCLSCFTSNFTGYLPYAYRLENLGHYYRCYQDLMSHWSQVLPLPIHVVQYEQLIADPETEIRKLIAFLDLPWDARCLAPHLNDRAVATASSVQVREPIYRKSLNRSARFEPYLGPLRAALNGETDCR